MNRICRIGNRIGLRKTYPVSDPVNPVILSGFLLLGMSQQEFMSYTADPGFLQTAFLIYQGLAALLLAAGSVRAAAAGRSLRPVGALLTGLFAAAVFGGIIGLVIR